MSRVGTSALRRIHLTAFKNFKDVVLPVDGITVVTGRNSAGKSNALDALDVLSRLAEGQELADALDSRHRADGPIRGGSRGCAPHGTSEFSIGCAVESDGDLFELDVTVGVGQTPRILREVLKGPVPGSDSVDLFCSLTSDLDSSRVTARVYGDQPDDPVRTFQDVRLLTSQLEMRIDPREPGATVVLRAVTAVTTALRGVFHLDPIPHLMRGYVSENEINLRRTGENLSAVLAHLARADRPVFERVVDLIRRVGDSRVRDVIVTEAEFGDTMFALVEGADRATDITPAREVSDGLLRFIAIVTTLLTSNSRLDLLHGASAADDGHPVLVVIEELENGLHPSQSGLLLDIVREVNTRIGTQVMFTTHSPAMLNMITGELNDSVIVCHSNVRTGQGELTRLPDLPGYSAAMATGRLGDIVTAGRLVDAGEPDPDHTEFNRLLGIE